ncbi:MAG: hypothetical protein JW395_2156 [Nitrospira sp.]|nr:hypothetical protein [Nitrospira sp.]
MRRATNLSLGIATVVLWWGILINAISGEFAIFPDSPGYQVTEGFPISWVGESERAWPVPLLFSLSPNFRVQVLLQSIVFGAGWTMVLWVFLRGLRPWVAGTAAGVLVALALTPLYLQWTLTILSEATTLGLLLVGLALAQVTYTRSGKKNASLRITWLVFVVMLVSLGMASMSRLTLLIFVVVLGAVLVVRTWRAHLRVSAGVMAVCLAVMSLYVMLLNSRIDEHWGISRTATYYGYLTATGTPSQGVLADSLYEEMTARGPACLTGLRASAGGVDGPDPWQLRRVLNTQCPAGVEWLESNFQAEYLKFAISRPAYLSRFILEYLPATGDPGGYVSVTSILPAPVTQVFSSTDDAGHAYRPIYLWILVGFGALAMAVVSRRQRSSLWAGSILGLAGIVASLLALGATIVSLNSEVARISSQATALLITCVVLAWAGRSRLPVAAEYQAEASSPQSREDQA